MLPESYHNDWIKRQLRARGYQQESAAGSPVSAACLPRRVLAKSHIPIRGLIGHWELECIPVSHWIGDRKPRGCFFFAKMS
jgi:hypothetical protein